MNFAEQIKSIRKQSNLSQEEFAQKLSISRQAVSNWENNRNLPDIEMLIMISRVFGVSLDQLILGENNMNEMTEKLIKDGSATRRAKLNAISSCIGIALLLIGAALIGIKALSVEYVDASGVLHENFFLIVLGFFFTFCGLVTFCVTGVRNLIFLVTEKTTVNKKIWILYLCVSAAIIALNIVLFVLLVISNS